MTTGEPTPSNKPGNQLARPLFYLALETTKDHPHGLANIHRFVGQLAGVSDIHVHRARVVGMSDANRELRYNPNHRLEVNPNSQSALGAVALDQFETRGNPIPREDAIELIETQLAIDDAQRRLNQRVSSLHSPQVVQSVHEA